MASGWKLPERDEESAHTCARCEEHHASINICEPCLVEVAQLISPAKERSETKRIAIAEWAGIVLLSSCAIGIGILLATGYIQY